MATLVLYAFAFEGNLVPVVPTQTWMQILLSDLDPSGYDSWPLRRYLFPAHSEAAYLQIIRDALVPVV